MGLSKKLLDTRILWVRRRSAQKLCVLEKDDNFKNNFKKYLDVFAQGNLGYERKLREYFS